MNNGSPSCLSQFYDTFDPGSVMLFSLGYNPAADCEVSAVLSLTSSLK